MLNFLYNLQKEVNTTRLMLEEFKERMDELSQMELAFLAEIYDRMLDDDEVFLT